MKLFFASVFILSLLTACSEPTVNLQPLDGSAVILAFGDSLTYGTGANHKTESYPYNLEQLTGNTVINAGIPGETSSQGLQRLPKLLDKYDPDLVILCHGGNDLIRRMSKAQLKANLEQMILEIKKSDAQIVLIAVPAIGLTLKVPDLYLELAEKYQLPIETDIIPELEGSPSLKSDQVHPNALGYQVFAESIHELLQRANALKSLN